MKTSLGRHFAQSSVRAIWSTFGVIAFALIVLSSLVIRAQVGSPPATVVTDKSDYVPGSTANITGAGFQPHEFVRLQVLHAPVPGVPPPLELGADHDPWIAQADAVGGISSTWHVCEDDCVGATLELTAEGLASGKVAKTTFTDAIRPTLDGWFNVAASWGGTANGSNSQWKESETIPVRFVLEGLTGGMTYTAILQYDFVNPAGGHLFDSLRTYDTTINPSPNLTTGVAGLGAAPTTSTAPIPIDTSLPAALQVPANFTLYNISSFGVTPGSPANPYTLVPGSNGVNEKTLSVTFTVAGTGVKSVIIGYGGHLGAPIVWGAGGGASSFNGGSGKMYASLATLNSLLPTGSRENFSLNPGAIPPPPVTTTTISAPTITYGDNGLVTVTVTSAAGTPTGNIVLNVDSGAQLLQQTLNASGSTTFTLTLPNAGSHPLSATYIPSGYFATSSATGSLLVNPRPITVTATAGQSKPYGAPDPAAYTYGITVGSLVGTDTFSGALTRVAGETIGNYAILQGTLALSSNYVLTYIGADFAITARAASVTPNPASKTYGDADPALTGVLSGFLPGDGVTATYSRTAGETVAGSPYTISATLAPAAVLSNYTITYNTANFTITPKTASVKPNIATKTYGDPDPAFTGTLTGFLPADGVTATYTRTAGETVAGNPYTISATLAPAAVLTNYTISYLTADFKISPKPASVTPNPGSKTYGDPEPALTGTLNGFLPGDGVTATYARTVGETVAGSPYVISATLAPAGVLGNYSITYNTANFTITPKAASVTPNPASKVYGDADPAFTGVLAGFLPGDGVTATYSRTAGETVLGGPYTISATLAPAGVLTNYTITYNTANFTITPKTASVSPNPSGKVYGSSDPVFTGVLSGFLPGDGVTATYSRTAGETVAGSPYAISATLAPVVVLSNYTINYRTAEFKISPKPASVTPNAAAKVYGDGDPALTGTLTGFLVADGVTATYARTAGETVAGSPYTISAALAPAGVLTNYAITYNTASFTITPRSASVTPNPAGKIYGDADPGFTGVLAGFLGGDGVTATYARTAGETVAGSPYTISAALAPAGVLANYSIAYNTADFTITPKPASVTPNASGKTYGSADPAFTGVLSGFLPADGITATYARTAGEVVSGSPYTISATLAPAGMLGNYSITYNTANFTITPKAASVTPNAASKTYGSADPAFTGVLSGFLPADGITATYARVPGETVAGGPYAISATLYTANALANYSVTYNTANFTITPLAASVTVNAAGKTYGSPDPVFTGVLSGFLGADGVTATYTRTAGETVAGSPYTISATLAPAGVLSNYSITNTSAAFTIVPKPASVTPNAASKVFGSADPVFTGVLSGFLAADGVTATYTRTAGETVAGSPYTISATLAPAGVLANYMVTSNTANFMITKAPSVTVVTVAASFTQDCNPHGGTAVVTGAGGLNQAVAIVYDGILGTIYGPTMSEPSAPGSYSATAVYPGDANHFGSSDVKSFSIVGVAGPVQGQPLYTGSLFFWTTGPSSSTASLALSATVKNVLACAGDISGATVTFWASMDGTNFSKIPNAVDRPVGLVVPTDTSVGTASAIAQWNMKSNGDVETFFIRITVGGTYALAAGSYDYVVTVAKPGLVSSMIGGGVVSNTNPLPASSGFLGNAPVVGDPNYYTALSANVKYNKSGTNPQGKVTVQIQTYNRPDGTVDTVVHHYLVTSTAITELTLKGANQCSFSSKVTVKELLPNGEVTTIDSGNMLQITLIDGSPDQVGITVQKSASQGGGLWYSSGWGPSATGVPTTIPKAIQPNGNIVAF